MTHPWSSTHWPEPWDIPNADVLTPAERRRLARYFDGLYRAAWRLHRKLADAGEVRDA